MATALDISEKGMLLETSAPIHASTIKVMVPIKNKETFRVMGNVIYSIPMPNKHYRTGIIFHESEDDITQLVELFSNTH